MARPETPPKTKLAERIRFIRKQQGDPDRSDFAKILGINKNTIAFYERGERTPDAHVLESYSRCFNIDLNWLVTGNNNAAESIQPIENKHYFHIGTNLPRMLSKLSQIVLDCFQDGNMKPTIHDYQQMLFLALEELCQRVVDPYDLEEVEAVFPQLKILIKRKIVTKSGA